jgi:ankyrin repeat protein
MGLADLPPELRLLVAEEPGVESSINSLLACAAREGDSGVASFCILLGGDPSKSTIDGHPLFVAIYRGHQAMVKRLLDTGMNINMTDEYGVTQLICATSRGHNAAMVKMIVETESVNVDSEDSYKRTALSYAAPRGKTEMVEILLHTGKVNRKSRDSYGRTPLHHAAFNGHRAVVEKMLGIEPLGTDLKDEGGQTPLSLAASGGRLEVIEIFLKFGYTDLDSKDANGRTPLFHAASRGHERIVERFLEIKRG